VPRFESVVAGLCLGAWLAAGALLLGGSGLGRFPSPGSLFPAAAVLGWLAGNFYVQRTKRSTLGPRGLLSLYLGGPPGLLWLVWATVPPAIRLRTAITPFLALGIYLIFFLVPVSLRSFPRR